MIPNLFSVFDPSTSLMLSMNWLSIFLPLIFLNLSYWVLNCRISMIWFIFIGLIYKEFKILLLKMKINLIIFLSLIIYLMLMNFLGLMPYIFVPTSHMSVNLSLSLILWMIFMIYGWLNFYNKMLIHMVPMNTPGVLMNFMVLIEFISNLIRPFTLAIRLTANMLAGHLLILLLSMMIVDDSLMIIYFLVILVQIILFVLEISVAFIQSYVFSILSLLYLVESNH